MKSYNIQIKSNEEFILTKEIEKELQKLFIKEALENNLLFIAGITESNKLLIKAKVKEKDLDKILNFKDRLERLIFKITNGEESYSFCLSIGYGE